MIDGHKRVGMDDQSETQNDTDTFSNSQDVSETGQKGGQASKQQDQIGQMEDTDNEESYTGDK